MPPTKEQRNRLLVELMPAVRKIALEIYRHLPESSTVELEDLIQEGMLAVLRAFSSLKKGSIENGKLTPAARSYLLIRAKGAMFDFLRSLDFGAKNIRAKEKEIEQIRQRLREKLKREPTEEEVAKELGISTEELFHLEEKIGFSYILSLEELFNENLYKGGFESVLRSGDGNIEETVERKELLKHLLKALEKLDQRELLVLQLYFFEGLKTEPIAQILEISPGRVAQIKKKALKKLATELSRYL